MSIHITSDFSNKRYQDSQNQDVVNQFTRRCQPHMFEK